MTIRFRRGAAIVRTPDSPPLHWCEVCHRPRVMHTLALMTRYQEKQRVYVACIILRCPQCQSETTLPTKRTFAERGQAEAFIRQALQGGDET